MDNQWFLNLLLKNQFDGDRNEIYQLIDSHINENQIEKLSEKIIASIKEIQDLKLKSAFEIGFDLARIFFDKEQYFNSINLDNTKIIEFSNLIEDRENK